HILYVEGQYRGPLYPRTITANGLMVLHSRYAHDANGRTVITNQLDTFIEVQNVGADLVAKTFQNVFGHTTDHNFTETAGFVSKLSKAVEDNPQGIQRMAAKLTMLDPQARARFAQVAAQVTHPAPGEDDQPAGTTTATPTRGTSMRR
ncbi:MAG: hypothetical protein K8T25_14550, partial [Planctomycetia bacterium]|nr:hypothetical protein [Planctomycetia bacterium]